MPELPAATDFSGLVNQARRVVSYSEVLAPEAAKEQSSTGFEAAEFQLMKPPRPFILKPRPPVTLPPLLGGSLQ